MSGGKRPNAGRPKGAKNKKTIEQTMALEMLRERISAEWKEIINSIIQLALGVWVERKIGAKKIKVYQKAPDAKAIEYLMDRFIGKVTQPVGEGKDGLSELTNTIRAILEKK